MKDLDIQIGLAKPKELPEIWDLFKRTYLDAYVDDKSGITRAKLLDFLATDNPYFPKSWQKYLEHPSKERTVYVARHEGKVVGMVAPVVVNGRHRITGLYVEPDMQTMGVGTRLMKKALGHHGNVDVYIGIATHVSRLKGFYEHFGFRVVNSVDIKRYPPDPMSYLEMMRAATID